MSSLAMTQLATAEDFARGFGSWTLEGNLRTRTNDCLHVVLPSTAGISPMNNEQFTAFFNELSPLMSNFKFTTHKILNSPEQHMAVIHAAAKGDTPVGPYANEYAFFLHLTDDGKKVNLIEEFLDSGFVTGLMAKLEEMRKSQEAK